ncbi:MAG: Lrp/AsnC ligand binding domain-containing protein [Ignisphaera sp.]|nr:Lrp/AsnC ligand binding domain-containing protein [Ignisphaera sp.]MCX8167991.1 Lrp/AsnC ligand binding domain-containing protein [Ignisphaera sp.]MDW8086003.1 Lrp/AsnC ligand binding domain-containing protein [Ignisphaera sp.]
MPEALVLINTDVGAEEEVLSQVRSINGVKEVYIVYGVYDLYTRIEANTVEDLKNIISTKIRRLPKVRSTITMVIVSSSMKSNNVGKEWS